MLRAQWVSLKMLLNDFWRPIKRKVFKGRKSSSYRARETAENFSPEQSENFLPPKIQKINKKHLTRNSLTDIFKVSNRCEGQTDHSCQNKLNQLLFVFRHEGNSDPQKDTLLTSRTP